MYNVGSSRILINGCMSTEFNLTTPVRQDCPMSMVLFSLAIEPFLRFCTSKLKGTSISTEVSKASVYANICVFLNNDQEIGWVQMQN